MIMMDKREEIVVLFDGRERKHFYDSGEREGRGNCRGGGDDDDRSRKVIVVK